MAKSETFQELDLSNAFLFALVLVDISKHKREK
ncbi:hypothetical protein PMF13cell1_02449 [Blautia producta]|uniref:Uncharacterized protein n=1 Tax=Blautia producta TaxID=33035 RepID=A0A4P6LYD7_9FIRM|nr:hypothetical protein PMF13cell1_02449 [Blautia producta]